MIAEMWVAFASYVLALAGIVGLVVWLCSRPAGPIPTEKEYKMSQQNNIIKILRPWKKGSIWAFDDWQAGLRGEPFVGGTNKLIDELVRRFQVEPDKEGKISLLFSEQPFPGAIRLVLKDQDWFRDNSPGGVTYIWEEEGMEAWLCPAFYHYFNPTQVPFELYAQAAA